MTKFLSTWRAWLLVPVAAAALLLASLWAWRAVAAAHPSKVAYTDLLGAVEAGRVASAEIGTDTITAHLKDAPPSHATLVADRIPSTTEAAVVDDMRAHGVAVYGKTSRFEWLWPLVWGLLPVLAIPGLLYLVFFAGNKTARPMSFGTHKAKLYDRSRENPVTFADVAGVEEAKAELAEVVGFLKNTERYRAVGAHVPKGVLLVGPPGTGKTLLAKAVAGEAGVPFFSMSGSEFVEMFVGVGASRVRDLFLQAKERAPCIVFIDELDAVGKSRGGGPSLVGNDERDQTLNQLLVEMDGFDSGNGIIIMAATNRPEVLDRALLRPGRFDRDVLVDRPDVRGREAILGVHARRLRLGADVDLKLIAQRTPGMVGADLANVVNEAALASVRRGGEWVGAVDFEEAIDRMQLGLKKQGRAMCDHEKRRVAFHEGGHALVALSMRHADPVHRVTIIPRTIGALGATLQLPEDDKHLLTTEELRDRICVLLGGRVAEELACDDVSTGAENDFERATEIARQMVCRWGMSELGPITFARGGPRFAGIPELGSRDERECSEATSRTIDSAIAVIVTRELERARAVLGARRDALDAVARVLLEKETLERCELEAIAVRSGIPLVRGPEQAPLAPAAATPLG